MPNPFNMSTSICFDLPKDDHVTLFIYNQAGRMVKKFLDKRLSAGIYRLDWHGLDYNGNPVASGCYIIRFHVDGHTQFKKMTLLK